VATVWQAVDVLLSQEVIKNEMVDEVVASLKQSLQSGILKEVFSPLRVCVCVSVVLLQGFHS